MENHAELSRLEQFVETLLDKHNTLKQHCHMLQATLQDRDAECAALKNDLSQLREERAEVGGRVSHLLDKIERWEAGEESDGVASASGSGVQGSLFGAQ